MPDKEAAALGLTVWRDRHSTPDHHQPHLIEGLAGVVAEAVAHGGVEDALAHFMDCCFSWYSMNTRRSFLGKFVSFVAAIPIVAKAVEKRTPCIPGSGPMPDVFEYKGEWEFRNPPSADVTRAWMEDFERKMFEPDLTTY